MVHGWYQNPFPTHTLKCPQSDERDHTACSRRQNEEGSYPEVPHGHQRIARPLHRQANHPKTTAPSFSRLGLCALTIWAAEYFAR